MTNAAKQYLKDLLGLSEEDRVQIATELLASLDGPSDRGWDDAWSAELERRQQEAKSRGESGSDWADVRARILARLGHA